MEHSKIGFLIDSRLWLLPQKPQNRKPSTANNTQTSISTECMGTINSTTANRWEIEKTKLCSNDNILLIKEGKKINQSSAK